MVTLQISPYTNVTLGSITLFMGDMGEGSLHREDEVTVKQRTFKPEPGGGGGGLNGRAMSHEWGRRGTSIDYWWESQRERETTKKTKT
jgi:hypothetical protein